jgi:hypothetical protein
MLMYAWQQRLEFHDLVEKGRRIAGAITCSGC